MSENSPRPSRLTRRQAIRRGAGGAAAPCRRSRRSSPPAAALERQRGSAATRRPTTTTAAGPTPAAEVKGDLVLAGYPDWYGPERVQGLRREVPGRHRQERHRRRRHGAQIAQLSKNKGDYDLTLAGINASEQFKLAGLLEPFDPARVPNISGRRPRVRQGLPVRHPHRLRPHRLRVPQGPHLRAPHDWKELWELAAKYKGKTTAIKYDSDIQGMALRYLGYSVNTKDDAELDAMQKALLELKPNLKAIIDTDFSKALVQGDVFFAIDYDYDIALAQESNKNIVWVQPTEGVPAYLEGWVALADSENLPAVWALMDFHLEPKNYASFVNAMGPAYTVQAAEPYIKKSILDNPVLKYNEEALKGVEFEGFLGPEQTAKRGKLWEQFLAA